VGEGDRRRAPEDDFEEWQQRAIQERLGLGEPPRDVQCVEARRAVVDGRGHSGQMSPSLKVEDIQPECPRGSARHEARADQVTK
jgi:hypothetical protein